MQRLADGTTRGEKERREDRNEGGPTQRGLWWGAREGPYSRAETRVPTRAAKRRRVMRLMPWVEERL